MAYTPTEWKNGDVITAEKLNKLENGVSNGPLEVEIITTEEDGDEIMTLNKTWQEIYDAFPNVYTIRQNDEAGVFMKEAISQVVQTSEVYMVGFISRDLEYFSAETANSYPNSRPMK